MKRFIIPIMAIAAAGLGATAASATTFDLSPIAFYGGGSLSGSISLNDAETMITGYDLVTTAGNFTLFGIHGAPQFPTLGATYEPSNSLPVAIPVLSDVSFASSFLSGLGFQDVKVSADKISFGSATEYEFIAGRSTGAGSFVAEASNSSPTSAVPEPVTWAMMIGGFGLIGGLMRRAHRKSEERFTRKVRSIATA